ncbi:YjjG family noncanonical pyrimidine nucleotidase [Kaistella jeonii]|uniref:HAD family hydrolase n=1 Tax=Kaistella jeonii TaxID=266749 RepID=A0A0C1FBY8_9FLAO|nr:YjjG family noncanonical pyrimidine nucleotidase [Kaistella jeonii]KIA89388.1 HAD family hydrolase [Kaistella jeonii]SFC04536.1 putative hydrolase of the HAD superfamily [Kaistella jeonii]VEI96723.1 Putative HAD-hydrolase yfnB [Kaistella jeonii]
MKIQHIFFDLDNTLWDHRRNAYLTLKEIFKKEQVSERYNLDFEEFHTEYFTINERLWEQIRDGEIDKEYLREHRFYDTFVFFGIDDFELSQTFETQFLDEILNYNDLVEGAFEILEYLSEKKYKLHILSNGFKEVTFKKCELSGIKNYFQTITSADEINIRKPQPEVYDYALKKAEAKIEESMMIGDDWIADVEGGKSFGLKVVFFDVFNDNFEAEDVKVIKKLKELKDFL